MLQRTEQEVAEPAPLRIGSAQGAFLQQVDKEILCEVLRVLASMPTSPNEGVNRVAIKAIELLKGSAGLYVASNGGGSQQSPLGRAKAWPYTRRRIKWRVHQTSFCQKCLWHSRRSAPSVRWNRKPLPLQLVAEFFRLRPRGTDPCDTIEVLCRQSRERSFFAFFVKLPP
jgi:hypothetical protein